MPNVKSLLYIRHNAVCFALDDIYVFKRLRIKQRKIIRSLIIVMGMVGVLFGPRHLGTWDMPFIAGY